MGPWIVTADEIPDPQQLALRCEINGEVLQDDTTPEMIFAVAFLVSYLSRFMTLEPGDVIATGTPSGVGAFRKPPRWLKSGDRFVSSSRESAPSSTGLPDRAPAAPSAAALNLLAE